MMLLIAKSSFGYIYYARVEKIIKNNQPQYIVLLSDYHDKRHPANKHHRKTLVSLLQKLKAINVKLIVEDLSSVNNDGRMICCNYAINCAKGVLGHLANKARSFGIGVDNVEYRYCRVASIGPLINNIELNPHSFRSSAGITLLMLYQEIFNEIEKVKRYDDGKLFNAFYKRVMIQVQNRLAQMGLYTRNEAFSVAQHCVKLQKKNYKKELEKLCIFDSALIDVNILHSIMQSIQPIIFVVAGGSHIEQVCKKIKQMGGETIFSTSLERVTQSIDLAVLDRFISSYILYDKK